MAKTKPEPQTETENTYRIVTNPNGSNLAEAVGVTEDEMAIQKAVLLSMMQEKDMCAATLIDEVNRYDAEDPQFHKVVICWIVALMMGRTPQI